MKFYNDSGPINIGTGSDISILELAEMIKKVVGYEGNINWDITKPNGTPKKLLEVTKIHSLGWQHTIALKEGIETVYKQKFLI
jgi:GDP-L-fucose synthase